ncbi:hypothetical protein ALQ31_05355 [Pseudomonas amygdali pv. morsprunorum]|nr:hypothetical protein ALQ31_05355 [Pseudomonas amygdali pv. morsprunorum]
MVTRPAGRLLNTRNSQTSDSSAEPPSPTMSSHCHSLTCLTLPNARKASRPRLEVTISAASFQRWGWMILNMKRRLPSCWLSASRTDVHDTSVTGNADRERSNQLTCVAGFFYAPDRHPAGSPAKRMRFVTLCVTSLRSSTMSCCVCRRSPYVLLDHGGTGDAERHELHSNAERWKESHMHIGF